jgi:hypothetical protein
MRANATGITHDIAASNAMPAKPNLQPTERMSHSPICLQR